MSLAHSTPPIVGAEGPREPARETPVLSLATLVLVSVGFRLTALFLLRYGGSAPDFSDFRYYHDLASLSAQGYFPGIHFWSEYPPVFPWLAVAAYLATLSLPVWIQPYFWFDLALTLVLAAADAGSIIAIDRIGDAVWGKGMGRRSATLYAALFAPAFAVLGWFDTLPTFFLLLSLSVVVTTSSGATRARGLVGGFAAGIGAMVKLFPVVALPAVLVVAPRGQRLQCLARAVGAAILAILLLALPFLIGSRDTFLATFQNVVSRGSWESPWALLDGYYGTGVVASLADRLFFNGSATWGQPTRFALVWYVTALIVVAVYGTRLRAAMRAGTPRAAVAITALGVTLLLLVSRGFSQQFIVWLMPLIVILMPGFGGAVLAVLLTLDTLVLEGYLYVSLFPNLHRLLWVSVGIRSLVLIWFALECATSIDPHDSQRFGTMRRALWRPVAILATVGTIVTYVVLAPSIVAEASVRSGDTPAMALLATLSPTTAVVFSQPTVYDRFAGNVGPRPTLLAAEPRLLTWTGERSLNDRLESGVENHVLVAVVTDTSQTTTPLRDAISGWLQARYGPPSSANVGSIHVAQYDQRNRPLERTLAIQYGDGLTLAGISPAILSLRAGSPFTLVLRWVAATTIGVNYTVSIQLIDPNGTLVAQHDSMPVDDTMPTSGWKKGDVIVDPVSLAISPGLPPGTYALVVVVYDHDSLRRLPVRGPGGNGDHATIGTVTTTP